MKNIIFLLFLSITNTLLFANWELTGPGHSAVSSVYKDGNDLYVGASNTGTRLFHSTNNGDSWMLLNDYDSSPFEYIVDIIVNKNKIFVGTLKGLYTSTDNGKNWELDTINGKVSIIWDMKKNGDDIFLISGGKLFISKDNGKNWNFVTPENWGGWEALAIDGENLYLGGIGFIDEPEFLMSNDYGKTWQRTKDTLTGLKAKEIFSLAANGEDVYVGTKSNGLYISNNKGKTWVKSNSFNLNNYSVNCLVCKGDTVYAGNDLGFYYSTDRGNNWKMSFFFGSVYNILIYNKNIYLASSEGLGISTDFGNTWVTKQKGLGSLLIFDVAKHNDEIYAGSYQQGVFVSYDEANSWEQFDKISKYSSITGIAFLDSNIFTYSYYTGYLKYSNDFGKTWKSAIDSNGFKISKINCFAIDKYKNNIFAGSRMNGLYLSTDFGNNWHNINNIQNLNVRDIFIENNSIYLAEHQWGIYKSTDYGLNWVNFYTDNGLPDNVHFLALTLCQNNIIVGTYTSKNNNIKGLYISKDNGKIWAQVSKGTTIKNIIDLITYNNYVFAATDNGILLSSDCGENWFIPEHSLSTLKIEKLLIFKNNIYAATPEGVFKAPLSDFGITDVVDNQIEKHNYLYSYPPYPMPARDQVKTLIYWDTSIDIDKDRIEILDIFGNKIGDKKYITINKQSPYSGILTWNCSDISNGIYFILITHGTEKRAIKILVNK